MKPLYILFFLILLSFQTLSAQVLLNGGVTNPDHGLGVYGVSCQRIERAPTGKFFVYGTYSSNSNNFDGLTISQTGTSRFLAAYHPDGAIEWVRGVSNETTDDIQMCYAPTGSVYWGSRFYGSGVMGETTLNTDPQIASVAIGRYDTSGNFMNSFVIGQANTYEDIKDLTCDQDGNLIAILLTNATGPYMGLDLQPSAQTPFSVLLTKFSADGTLISAEQIGSVQYNFGNIKLAPAPGGDWYISAYTFSGALTFAGQSLAESQTAVARWRPGVGAQWLKPLAAPPNEVRVYDIDSDPAGNLAFAGSYVGQLSEGNPRDVSGYHIDVLVGKMDSEGHILWSRNGDDGSNFSETAYSVATDNIGNVFITGGCKGGLVFEYGGSCSSGPYQASFMASFHPNGSANWNQCNGSGTGTDLVVLPDQTIFSTGNSANGVSNSSTNYINHWLNRRLVLQSFTKTKYCTGDTIVLNWMLEGGSFPPGTQAYYVWQDSLSTSPTYAGGSQQGSSGSIRMPISHNVGAGEYGPFNIVLTIGDNGTRTPALKLFNSPVPQFQVDSYVKCLGSQQWLKPQQFYGPVPNKIYWEPTTGLAQSDSIAALATNIQESITYKVFFADTITGCVVSDTVRMNADNFQVNVTGPEQTFGYTSFDYQATITGPQYPPFTYQWPGTNSTAANPSFSFTTSRYVIAKVQDYYGCMDTDSLFVQYFPPKYIKGKVFDADSITPMTWTRILVYKKDNETGEVYSVNSLSLSTNSEGNFSTLIHGIDSILLLRVRPDTNNYPLAAPTWYTRKYFIQNAVEIPLNADTIILPPIRMLNIEMLPDSSGVLGGTIETDLPQFHSSNTEPVSNLVIWIADAERKPLRYAVTNASGAFHFGHLPYGTYYFMVDKMGINNDLAPSITIDAARPQAVALLGTLLEDRLLMEDIVSTQQPVSHVSPWKISPNPWTDGVLRLSRPDAVNQLLSISILDATGRIWLSRKLNSDGVGQASLVAPELPAGIYFMEIKDADNQVFVEKIIRN